MADLFLVRHGQGSFGTDNYDQLSPVGEAQARALGGWMAKAGHAPDAVAVGTLQRQIRTAELALEALGAGAGDGGLRRGDWLTLPALDEFETQEILPAYDPRYADRGAMPAEMAASANPRRHFQAVYAAAVARWVEGAHDGDYSLLWRTYRDQVLESYRRLIGLGARSVWAFTSGGPITAMVQPLLAIPESHAFEVNWALVNAGVTRIRFSATDGRASLGALNAYGHLEAAGEPALVTYR